LNKKIKIIIVAYQFNKMKIINKDAIISIIMDELEEIVVTSPALSKSTEPPAATTAASAS